MAKPAAAPKQGPAERITIEARAFHGIDDTALMGVPGREYTVEVAVLNTGPEPVRCDEVEAIFFSEKGGSLKQATSGKDGEPIVLEPNKPAPFNFSTASYTSDLLRRAQGEPMRFSLTLKGGGTNLLGPREAVLPSLGELPTHHGTGTNTERGRLHFR